MRVAYVTWLLSVLLVGCASQPPAPAEREVTLSDKDMTNVLEAAVRYRLSQRPLPRHVRWFVFIDHRGERTFPALAMRFPEYRLLVRYGSPGNSPPQPYYWILLGSTFADHAYVILCDATGGHVLELRRQGPHWAVTSEKPWIIV